MTTESNRLGPLRLAPGVRGYNAVTYLFMAFAGVSLTTFVSVIMPYVLNVNIDLPVEEQGTMAGDLIFYGEIVLLAMSGVFGAWADRFGRRSIMILGLVLVGMGYVTLGYVSNVSELIAVRVFITFGIAAVSVMVSTIGVDYPAEQSRGKMQAFAGMAIGIGAAIIGLVLTRLPAIYVGIGYESLEASRLTMFTMAGACVFAAVIAWFGLVGGKPPYVSGSPGVRELLGKGFSASRINPLLWLSYLCAFVGRADLVVVGTFYSLWLTQAGLAAGMSADEAARYAGSMFAVVMIAALLWAPVLGWLNDRLDRTLVMTISLLLALVGYSVMGLIGDPVGSWLIPASIILGIGQISVTLASQTLLGQESPRELRGAVVGTFSVFGAAGILFVTSVGGRIYDAISPAAPFVMIGVLNGLLALFSFWLWKQRKTTAAAVTETG